MKNKLPHSPGNTLKAGCEKRLVRLLLSDVKDLRMKMAIRQSVADAKPLFARAAAIWNDPRYSEILGDLQHDDVEGDYSMVRAIGCLNAGFKFAASMSGHAFGWVDEGLRIIEYRISNLPNAKHVRP